MTDKEALEKYEAMKEYFGTLPNFIHYPKQFAYHVKLYDYYKERKDESSTGQ